MYIFINKLQARRYIFSIAITFIITLIALSYLHLGKEYYLNSYFLIILTLLVVSLTKVEDLDKINIVGFAAYSVFIAFGISIISTYFQPLLEIRTNAVLGFDRLTFFFEEPSHYGIFLALSLVLSILNERKKTYSIILSIGLLFTWSLSGFILFILLFFITKVRTYSLLKIFIFSFVLLILSHFIWTSILFGSDLWIFHKINSLLLAISGEATDGSALARLTSATLGGSYLIQAYQETRHADMFFGEGFGNGESWVFQYFFVSFGLTNVFQVNNIFSSIIINTGLVGVVLYLCSYFIVISKKFNFKRLSMSLLILFMLSMFSGYAYGNLALLFLYQSIMIVNSIFKSEKVNV